MKRREFISLLAGTASWSGARPPTVLARADEVIE